VLKSFKKLSFKKKTFLYATFISIISLIIACATFITYDTYSFRRLLVQNYLTLAEIIGKTSASALVFQDSKFASKVLAGLEAETRILAACIYENDGSLFASYLHGSDECKTPTTHPGQYHFHGWKLDIHTPISFEKKQVGILFIRSDLGELFFRIMHYVFLVFGVMILSLLGALSISGLFQQIITQPLLELEKTAKLITDTKDYSKRAIKYTFDELGNLTNAFNEMLTEIQKRDSALLDSKVRMRTLIETLPDLVWLKDPDGVFLFCNRKFERCYGAKEEEIVGKTDYDFVNKESADFFHEKDKAAITAGKPCMNEEMITYADDGHMEAVETIKTPMLDLNNTLIGVLGIARDITGRKQTEQLLLRAQKMDALGKLTGGIAHDFNNMLSVIIGYTELLQSQCGDNPVYNRYLKNIQEASSRSKNMTDKLLSFSRKKSSNAEKANLNELIISEKEMLAKTLTVSIEIKLDLCESPWPVWIDISEFQDVLLNLSINAQHAMQGHGTLTFKTVSKTLSNNEAKKYGLTAGDYMQLTITDTGTGMDDETQAKIFDPFFSTKGEKGTGLGLSQVFGFVQRSDGTISVDSQLGHGTKFMLFFPHHQTVDLPNPTDEMKDMSNYSGHETLLVVDDEPALRDMLTDILTQSGYQVRTAEVKDSVLFQNMLYKPFKKN